MITTAGVTHSQAVGVSPKTRCVREGARSTATATRRQPPPARTPSLAWTACCSASCGDERFSRTATSDCPIASETCG